MSSHPLATRGRHLRVFLVSLGILLLGLGVFVFAVSMESTATAEGQVTAGGLREVRAPCAGLIELVHSGSGAEVRGGEAVAMLRPSVWWQGGTSVTLRAPESDPLWLLAEVPVSSGQAVEAGQRLLTLVPLDPKTRQPRQMLARLAVSEEHIVEVKEGQQVRVSSNLYSDRVHGKLSAVVERIEPMAEKGSDGKRRIQVTAVLEPGERVLLLGSGVKAEIVLGRKRVYRIILEH